MNKNKFNNGQNLSEFGILLLILAVVAVIGLTLLGQNVFKMFRTTTAKTLNYDPIGMGNISEVPAGTLGGTPDKPVKQCNGKICIIDFGNFILNGMPADFNEFVETGGSSGGTDTLSNLIDQIAQQLEKSGKPDESLEFKKLANIGHNLAAIQKEIEKEIKNCKGDITCMRNLENKTFPKPPGYDETYGALPAGKSYFDMRNACNIGLAMNSHSDYLAQDFVDQYKKLMNISGVDDNIKGVVRELTWDIGTIGEDFENNYSYIQWGGSYNHQLIDPLTGQFYTEPSPTNVINNFEKYRASKITNADSALICASGWRSDNGVNCH